VQLVIADAHLGLRHAVQAVLAGAAMQRCRVHFLRNVLARVPKGSAETATRIGLVVAAAEQEVGDAPGGDRQPVGSQPVQQRRRQRLRSADTGKAQRADQPRLDKAKATRRERHQRQQPRGAVGEHDQRGSGAAPTARSAHNNAR